MKLSVDHQVDGKPADGKLKITMFHEDGTRKTAELQPPQKTFSMVLEKGAVRFVVTALGPDGKEIPAGEKNGKKTVVSASIGVIADPLEIKPGFQEPADFQQFWDNALAELAKVPVKAVRKEADLPERFRKDFKCWDVQVDCAGNAPVHGYLTMPIDAAPKSLGVLVSYQGAGVYSSFKSVYPNLIHLNINAHGIINGQPPSFYKDLYGRVDGLKGYVRRGMESRDKFYFRNMFLRVKRALDYVKTLPEYDGKTLIVTGSSQGGAQAIVAAALDPDVILLDARVPAMCDHGGVFAGRHSGWPQLIRLNKEGKPADPKIVETLRYYDMAFFARRVKVETFFTVGLIDTTCCPTSVYAAFNEIRGKKQITTMPAAGHIGKTSVPYLKRREELTRKKAKK